MLVSELDLKQGLANLDPEACSLTCEIETQMYNLEHSRECVLAESQHTACFRSVMGPIRCLLEDTATFPNTSNY